MRAVTQRRPVGPDWPIDKDWKEAVLDEMKARGWTQAEMARHVGVTPASISYLLSPTKTWQSKLVPAVHAALGWPPPMTTVSVGEDDLADIRRLWTELTREQKLLVTNLAEQLTRKK